MFEIHRALEVVHQAVGKPADVPWTTEDFSLTHRARLVKVRTLLEAARQALVNASAPPQWSDDTVLHVRSALAYINAALEKDAQRQ